MKFIVMDSTPLGLLTQRPDAKDADECRNWLAVKTSLGIQIIVPEIVDYELRRELIRSGKTASIRRLDIFISHRTVTFLPITSAALKLAANMWAKVRQQGTPTADFHALDIDVILAAQVISAGIPMADFVVATANVGHLSLFVPAKHWSQI